MQRGLRGDSFCERIWEVVETIRDKPQPRWGNEDKNNPTQPRSSERVLAVDAPRKSGITSYTTHFVFVPKSTLDIPGVGKAVALEATGPTENTKGDAFLDKMMAKCAAVNVDSGGKKWIDGGCALTDADGDVVFSTFDTRDLDKSQPKMDCGTHTITGGLVNTRVLPGKSLSPASIRMCQRACRKARSR